MKVPNKPPTKPAARRIAIIGDVADVYSATWHCCNKCQSGFATQWRDERGWHTSDRCTNCFSVDIVPDPQPLVGPAGWTLNKLLAGAGIDRECCFVGNVEDVEQLRGDLAAYQPHFCLLLGNDPLRIFSGDKKRNVGDWRGSLFMSDFVCRREWVKLSEVQSEIAPHECFDREEIEVQVKCMATYHPAALLREAGLTPYVRMDMARIVSEARTDTIDLPVDDIEIDLSKDELIAKLRYIYDNNVQVAVDLEGYCDHISCIGFADGSDHAFVVPFIRVDNSSYWSEDDEVELWEWVAKVLEKQEVPKVCHNGIYEMFTLLWTYGICMRGMVDDTMVAWFEGHCELEKSLAVVVSLLTRHPFYKFERKTDDDRVALYYNGKDCCRTFEVLPRILAGLMPKQREHYRQNMLLLTPLVYMMARGMRFDHEAAQARLAATIKRIYALQDKINREAASSRPALRNFYRCLEAESQPRVEYVPIAPGLYNVEQQAEAVGAVAPSIVSLLRTAFCLARCSERRLVTEVSYAPHHWNGKRWVKKGKRLSVEAVAAKVAEGWWQGTNAPSLNASDGAVRHGTIEAQGGGEKGSSNTQSASKPQWWLKPVEKEVERVCEVAIETFEDVRRFAKDSCKDGCRRALQLLGAQNKRANLPSSLTPAQRGELATLLNLHVKVNATAAEGDAQWFLYEHCGLPKQFIKEGNKLTTKLASDDEAVIKAWTKTKDRRAIWFLNLRQLITSTKSLRAAPDADGRIRGGANLVGTETHRIANYGSPTGSSNLNLSTITKGHRCLYCADEGYWMAQRDLAGADGWTVAAYAAMLGDTTMLDDYLAGLKPAQIICLMLDRGTGVNRLSRDELRPLCKPITESKDWRYFPMKRGQHGWTYLMGDKTTSDQILTDTFKKDGKPVYMEPKKLAQIRDGCFFVRYPGIPRLHQWMARELEQKGELRSSDGFVRKFYGRKTDAKTQREAMAHLPQYYTTRATVMALMRMWSDPENRRADGSLVSEPLFTQHDSLIYQFPKEVLEWGKRKSAEWFANEFLIAQTMLIIPASGTYGPSWGQQDHQL